MLKSQTARRVFLFGSLASLAFGLVMACTSVPDSLYGDPTALHSSNIPGEAGVMLLSPCEAGLPFDITHREAGADGGDGGFDAGGCAVSFSVDLYPRMLQDGGWHCADKSCHGGNQTPLMEAGSPESLLNSLRTYQSADLPLPYIPLGNKDPTKAGMECNLARTCGNPMPPSQVLAPSEVCAVETWLKCGAPGN